MLSLSVYRQPIAPPTMMKREDIMMEEVVAVIINSQYGDSWTVSWGV